MSELSFCTNEELVYELLSRTTFCGIVIRSIKEVRGKEPHQVWSMDSTLNLEPEQVHGVLTEITQQLGEKLAT